MRQLETTAGLLLYSCCCLFLWCLHFVTWTAHSATPQPMRCVMSNMLLMGQRQWMGQRLKMRVFIGLPCCYPTSIILRCILVSLLWFICCLYIWPLETAWKMVCLLLCCFLCVRFHSGDMAWMAWEMAWQLLFWYIRFSPGDCGCNCHCSCWRHRFMARCFCQSLFLGLLVITANPKHFSFFMLSVWCCLYLLALSWGRLLAIGIWWTVPMTGCAAIYNKEWTTSWIMGWRRLNTFPIQVSVGISCSTVLSLSCWAISIFTGWIIKTSFILFSIALMWGVMRFGCWPYMSHLTTGSPICRGSCIQW